MIGSTMISSESKAFAMKASFLEDDIEDALILYHRLLEHVHEETMLRESAHHAIESAQETLEAIKSGLQTEPGLVHYVSYRLFKSDYLRSLKYVVEPSHDTLRRRIEWMRTALSDLDAAKRARD